MSLPEHDLADAKAMTDEMVILLSELQTASPLRQVDIFKRIKELTGLLNSFADRLEN